MASTIVLSCLLLSLIIWLVLLLAWGNFWRCDQRLDAPDDVEKSSLPADGFSWPAVAIVIPARNEADVIQTSVSSLLTQDYPGPLSIWVVDDQSDDGTGDLVTQLGTQYPDRSLHVLPGQPLPPGWSGKLWALEQGTQNALQDQTVAYVLLTDADIQHPPTNVRQLVNKATTENLALVSLMVQLRCQSFWEKLLIPAFIFFFQKLYPFPWVNNPNRGTAAAAGGCILLKRSSLEALGGLGILRDALIDDCTLATQVKHHPGKPYAPIWLGLSPDTLSLRAYDDLHSIWQMVARTAYTQLYYSPWLLVGTVFGMGLVYLMAPLGLAWGLVTGQGVPIAVALMLWLLMAISYSPTIRLYQLSWLWTLALPTIAFLYSLMTLDSARQHWLGRGGAWKGRTYSSTP